MSVNPSKTIGLVGVRDHKGSLYTNNTYVVRILENHMRQRGLALASLYVVTGGGKGVEDIVIQWCSAKDIPFRKIPPNIVEFGPKKAFTIRNNNIVSQCDELVVFWDGCVDIISESIITAMQQSKIATIYPVI